MSKPWFRILAAVAVGTPAYLYYNSWSEHNKNSFILRVREKRPDGKVDRIEKSFPLLSLNDIENRIREHSSFQATTRPSGLTWNHTTAFLASNDPIEDTNSNQIIQRDDSDPSAPGDYLFFSRVLINAVALELSQLINKPRTIPTSYLDWIKSFVWPPQPSLVPSPQRVSLAVQDAFTKLDAELLNAPLHILANNVDEESKKTKKIPDLSKHSLALPTMLPAVSG